MIDKEIIIGVERGGSPVSRLEIGQMAGRCGRSYQKSGEVVLITSKSLYDYAEDCLFNSSVSIRSVLNDEMSILFHAIPSLVEKRRFTIDDVVQWYKRSLYAMQNPDSIDWESVFDDWVNIGAIARHKRDYTLTELGIVSLRCYIRPESVAMMSNKMDRYDGSDSLESAAWLMSYNRVYMDREEHPDYDEFMSNVAGRHLFFEDEESVESYAIYRAFLTACPKWIRHTTNSIKRELDRRMSALNQIAHIHGKSIDSQIELWNLQRERRVPQELYPLLRFFPDASIPVLSELSLFNEAFAGTISDDIKKAASSSLKRYLNGLSTSKTQRVM